VAWIALRDADCALIRSGTEGGSVQPMIASQCLTDKTNEREAFCLLKPAKKKAPATARW
ncbi:lysozyme inhibitor LprI family protein, partial [Salmonella enterica subsp. enterica serovar Kentucky]|nr:lysozyme inhibitor LprI family protein [Salmonella enterica subsp. enterica serovar Kentucky]